MAILLDEVNTITTKRIMPGVADNFFKAGPLMAYLRNRFTQKWSGPTIQENYLYKPMKGGARSKGASFDISPRQTYTGIQFTPKYYYTNVTQYKEDLEVEMTGPNAMFNKLRIDMRTAALTLSAILEIALFQHGQTGRTEHINGLEEMLNDGTNASWGGTTFTSYGLQTRADVSPALNSPAGLVAANVAGPISFRVLEHSFMSCVIGNERPVIGLTTNRCQGYIAETFHPSQRVDTVDPEINWPGMKFNTATILVGQYVPGADGVNDADLGNYNAANETFWWLNPGPKGDDAYMRLYIAASPAFAFGFTGFKGARDDNQVSGQIQFAGNLTGRAPRYSRVLHGITSA